MTPARAPTATRRRPSHGRRSTSKVRDWSTWKNRWRPRRSGASDRSDQDVAAPDVDPRILRRRADVSRGRSRRRLIVLLAAGTVVVLGVTGWFIAHSGLLSARVITVVGAPAGQDPSVIAAAGLAGHPPLIDVNPGRAALMVQQLPWVGRATVSRSWPDGVRVSVTRRVPVAVVAAGASGWAEVDRTGRVLADVTSAPAGLVQLRVPATPTPPGTWLSQRAWAGVEVASTLPAAFSGQVTVINAQSADAVRLQLTTPITVLLGTPTDLETKYDDVATILVHATLHPGDVIDVRVSGSPVISGP